MHIMFVSGEYPPQTGGVGAYTQELARALAALGVRCTVVVSRASVLEQHLTPGPSPEERGERQADSSPLPIAGGGVRVLPIVERWGMNAVRAIHRRALDLRADWIHVQYQTAAFNMNPAVNFAPRYWQRQARVAWTYHDLLPGYLFPKAGERLRDWVTELPAGCADAIVATNSADYRRLLQKHGDASAALRNRLHEIPIGSNVQGVTLTDGERNARRQRYGWGAEQVVLGYFGALNRSKGGMALLHVLKALVNDGIDAHLLMIGDVLGASDPTNAAFAEEVRRQIDRMGLQSRIQWTGREASEAISADLNAVDICLLPYADGASLRRGTLMAALANGCAIVTTAPQTPIANLRDGEEALFVPLQDERMVADSATAAVKRLLGDPALMQRVRANARIASNAFSWDGIARRHLKIYESLP